MNEIPHDQPKFVGRMHAAPVLAKLIIMSVKEIILIYCVLIAYALSVVVVFIFGVRFVVILFTMRKIVKTLEVSTKSLINKYHMTA